jgi:hexosaminidase
MISKRIAYFTSVTLIKSFTVLLLIAGGTTCLKAQDASARFPVIPYPQKLIAGNGTFTITSKTRIVTSTKYTKEATLLNTMLGNKLVVSNLANAKSSISLINDATITADEGYRLVITPQNVTLLAGTGAGMFRAIETIRQLLPASIETNQSKSFSTINLPAVKIEDAPTYAWRGMHLDVSRHFFSIDYLKKFIDLLALYKFNKFHLHLTDDQGWRIEIKKYPKLTQEGAWRTFNNQDSVCMKKAIDNPDMAIDPKHIIKKDGKTLYGGFYTQKQMKDVVAYATARHIDIIPEIDMPGHMMAAINSYPFLTCNGQNKWGKLFTTPICPCNEEVYEFAQNVYTEIMDIFPSKYIHIGGDEVDRTSWAQSDACKALMKKEGITTTAQLQSYFINRMEKFFNSKGRKLIGWDEILEGGISKTALVMYWRSWVPKAPVEAAKNGNQVIMTPGNPLYFDTPPDQNSVYNVYHFNPIPAGLTTKETKGIIGAQANLWTEYIPSENRADYMYMPRMTALAENMWTGKGNYSSYLQRLQGQYERLNNLKVNYRLPDFKGLVEQNVFTDETVLNLQSPLKDVSIHYTTDGSLPNVKSTMLTGPLVIKQPVKIRLAAFKSNGTAGDVYNLNYTQQTLAEPVTKTNVANGLLCNYYPGSYKSSKLMADVKASEVFTVNTFVVPEGAKAESFGLRYQGYLNIPANGIYNFYLTCDDGGILNMANREVVNNDGWHGPIEKSGQVALKAGLQPVELSFVEGGGGYTLKLKYSVNGSEPAEVPQSWLKH